VVFAVTAGLLLWAGLVTARISPQPVPLHLSGTDQERVGAQVLAGFRAIVSARKPRLLVALFGAQTFIRGALNVLVVVCALSLLKMGDAGVGFLNSAFGIGGLMGSFGALGLVGRRRLALPFGVGLLLWGIPIALVATVPTPALALILLALPGVGNSVLDVSGLTLLQRITPNMVLGRVFGVLEGLVMTSIGLGSIVAPALIEILGIRGALIVVGAFLPALAAVSWSRLREIDAEPDLPERQLALLRAIPLFGPLPVVTLEHLALSLIPVSVPAGSAVVREGEAGDRFFAIDEGEANISIEGVVGRVLGPEDYFGEIALLRDTPRTATVTARTDLSLFALERDEFISAVTGHPQSASAADAVIGTRLGSFRLRGASI
jgi:MFS family permease